MDDFSRLGMVLESCENLLNGDTSCEFLYGSPVVFQFESDSLNEEETENLALLVNALVVPVDYQVSEGVEVSIDTLGPLVNLIENAKSEQVREAAMLRILDTVPTDLRGYYLNDGKYIYKKGSDDLICWDLKYSVFLKIWLLICFIVWLIRTVLIG